MRIKGTKLFVEALKKEGVTTLFGYPGGFAIDLFDELYQQNQIEVILPRHEQALVHAADGYARSTGKTGVCLVTSGPGATNMVTAIATAYYDSIPLVCFTGQVPTFNIGNDAFQEVDIVGMTRTITKYSVTVHNREDLGRIIKEAFHIASTGRPGPVIVDLPKDIVLTEGDDTYPEEVSIRSYKPNTSVHIGQLKRALTLLKHAKSPLLLIGGGVKISRAEQELLTFVEKTKLPVVTTIMGRGCLPTNHPNYIGNIGMHGHYAANMAISQCDLLFSIGTRFNDRITSKIESFAKHAKIIHIDIDPSSISRNIKVDIPIVADAKIALNKLNELVHAYANEEWFAKILDWKKQEFPYQKLQDRLTGTEIIRQINEQFSDAIIVTDVGQHQMWTVQNLEMKGNNKLLTSGGFGTMGFGFPAAIGAQIGNPNRQVICISGDGGMQMNIQELATAVAQELPILICIFNNNYLGMVRQWQQLFYDKRYSSTCLRYRKSCNQACKDSEKCCPPYTPDFVKLAESYDAYGIRVFQPSEILPAFETAKQHKNAPTIIEFILESEDNVFPMVPGTNSLENMILEC